MSFEEVSLDEVRDYWNSRPCNLNHSRSPIGTREYFDEVTARKYMVEPHIPKFAEFHKWRDKRVLDIGCGLGTMTQSFAEAGAHVTAVDISSESLKLARQRIDVMGLSGRVEFYEANAERLVDFVPPEPYDLIFSFGVLHHTPHPHLAFGQLARYSHAGTRAKIMVYHRYSTKSAALVARHGFPDYWRVDRAIAAQSEAQFGCPITYTYSPSSGASLLQDAGFVVDNVKIDHIFPFDVNSYREYVYVKRLWWKLTPPSVFQKIERRVGWHLLIDAHYPHQ